MPTKNPVILAIETSCDETAAAVYQAPHGVLSNKLFSQIDLHKQFGGVIPELASRSHLEKINPIVRQALHAADKKLDDVDLVAVTNRPGLPGSLLVGVCFAKAVAYAQQKPIIGIDHLEGHAFSACIEHDIPFPFICLTASGGHTALYLVKDFGDYDVLGYTTDDAAGEAFDKVAKLVNLPYPGGPVIEYLAHSVGFEDFFHYPRSQKKTLNFSFSGLKTAVLYDLIKRNAYDMGSKTFLRPDDQRLQQQVASSLLVCIADIFVEKLQLALQEYPEVKAVTFVGGVACNSYIKDRLKTLTVQRQLPLFTPSPHYCTDNAAMIAFVANYKYAQGQTSGYDLDIF